jgi:hypothetical protein
VPIELNFTLSFEDYLSAQRLHFQRSWWPRVNQFLGRRVLPVVGVLLVIMAFLISGKGVPWLGFLLPAAFGVFLTLYPFYIRFKLKRCYIRTRTGAGVCTMTFGEDLIRTQDPNAKSEIKWTAIQSFSENIKVLLLFLAPAKFLVIPKRVCDESVISELRSLSQRKMQQRTVPDS